MKPKQIALALSAVVFLFLGTVALRADLGAGSVLADQPKDVLLLNCLGIGFPMSSSFGFQGSPGAPSATTTTCSQALADALNAGFEARSGQGDSFGVVY